MNINDNIFLAKRNIVDTIWKEANIEGVAATYPQTKEIFEGRAVSGLSIEETLVINNLKHAWNFLLDNVDVPFDIQYLKQLNFKIGEGLIVGAGDFRISDVSIGGTEWKPEILDYDTIKDSINNILANYTKEEKALEMFCFICRTQPFIDGNKRTAQLVANQILICEGNGILAIPVSKKIEFEELLIDYYETNDNKKLKSFLGTLVETIEFDHTHDQVLKKEGDLDEEIY